MLLNSGVSHRPWRTTESTLRVPGVAWACPAEKGISILEGLQCERRQKQNSPRRPSSQRLGSTQLCPM